MTHEGSSTPASAGLRRRLDAARLELRKPGRNGTKADILFYRSDHGDLVVKDYAARSWWIRNTLGRWLVRREVRAYRACAGLDGVPDLLGRVGPFAFALQRVEGRPLAELPAGGIDAACFDALERIVDTLHRRGVALGDLHHRDVLVGGDGVHVVDLATAWVAGEHAAAWRRGLFRRLCEADRVALARLRARHTGGDLQAAAEAAGPAAAARFRRARRFKSWWNRLRGRGV